MRKGRKVVSAVFCKSIMLNSVLRGLCTTDSSKATIQGCFSESLIVWGKETQAVSLSVRVPKETSAEHATGVKYHCGLCVNLLPP